MYKETNDIFTYNQIERNYKIISTVQQFTDGIIIGEERGLLFLFISRDNNYILIGTKRHIQEIYELYSEIWRI